MAKLKNQEKYDMALKELRSDDTTTLTYLAKKYCFDRRSFSRYVKTQGIEVKHTGSSTAIRRKQEEALTEYLKGEKSILQLSKEMNLSEKSLGLYFRKKNVEIRDRPTDHGIDYKLDEDFFEVLDTEAKAYWFGFILADGSVRVLKNGGHQLYVELQSQDRNHLQKFLDAINSNHLIFDRQRRGLNHSFIRINSKKMVNDLINKGCVVRKTYVGYLQNNIFLNNELKFHFLRGYIDGDGHISKKGYRITIPIKSEQLLLDIVKLIVSLDIDCKFKLKKQYSDFSGYYSEKRMFEMFVLTISLKENVIKLINNIYVNATIYLDRKYNIVVDKYDV